MNKKAKAIVTAVICVCIIVIIFVSWFLANYHIDFANGWPTIAKYTVTVFDDGTTYRTW